MNNEQLQDFLLNLSKTANINERKDDAEFCKKFLMKTAPNTLFAVNYIASNYTDVDLVQPVIGQIVALYYRGGLLRLYALQFIPTFISIYSLALAKKQQKSVTLFETYFLAIYNEEIMTEPNSDTKKVDEVRIASIRYPSIYHDPSRMQAHNEVTNFRPSATPSVLTTIRIGPYPSYSRINAENKFLILSRILKSVNSSLFVVSSEVAARSICLCTLSICSSGFSFPETGFRNKILDVDKDFEIIEDFSRKPRQQISGNVLLELLYGSYLALFNGFPDLALRAIDVINLRAQYEILPDVLLVVNSVRNSLLETPLSKEKRDEIMWTRTPQKEWRRHDLVTSASLRMKRMPEDIPVQETSKEKEHSKIGELVEEGIDHLHDLKKKVVGMGLHHKIRHRKKSLEHDDHDLTTIREEKNGGNGSVVTVDEVSTPLLTSTSPMKLETDEIERRLRDMQIVENDYSRSVLIELKTPSELDVRTTPKSDDSTRRSSYETATEGELEDELPKILTPPGSFSVAGLRHMDSGSSTQRSDMQ